MSAGQDTDWLPLLRDSELAEGEIRRCPLPQTQAGACAVVLACRVAGEVHVLADTCPHEAISLSLGSLQGHCLRCPLHGSEFDVRSGAVLSEPCETDLQRFTAELRDGWIGILHS